MKLTAGKIAHLSVDQIFYLKNTQGFLNFFIEPNLLLLDEPVSGIDQNGMELFYRTMDYLKKNFDLAIILISHDLDYVAKYADKVLLLNKTILKQGTPKEVYASEEFERIFGMEGRA